MKQPSAHEKPQGILLVNKPRGMISFDLVRILRRQLHIDKIGHAGTLDPFATGVMVMLVGRDYTRLSDTYLNDSKDYVATVKLGEVTDTYDCDGKIIGTSSSIPSLEEIEKVVESFQGDIEQTPPMYSAKKVQGKKLYELARQGVEIERKKCKVNVNITILDYNYPQLKIQVSCSKGTYIRSLAYDIGEKLECGGHLIALERTRSGKFQIQDCIDGSLLDSPDYSLETYLKR